MGGITQTPKILANQCLPPLLRRSSAELLGSRVNDQCECEVGRVLWIFAPSI